MTACIRRIGPEDAAAFRALRLAALAAHPEAFGSSLEEEAGIDLAVLRARLAAPPPDVLFGAFLGETLVGMAGLAVAARVKQRHKGTVWGVYVDPAQRGAGIAQALITALIDSAQAAGLGVLQLAVTVGNVPAIRLYEAAGFVRTGIEPRALRVGDRFLDEALMVRLLD